MTGELRFVRAMRLVRRGDFARAFARGSRARGEILLVVGHRNGGERVRLGLSVGRSVWRSAVKRNRVRRIFREAFRLEYAALPKGLDLVLVPARPGLEPELAATRKELVRLARKVADRLAAKPPDASGSDRLAAKPADARATAPLPAAPFGERDGPRRPEEPR